MKKFLRIISLILVCVLLVGCKDSNAEVKLASQKISSSLDKIVAEVKKMENIDTSSIDISQMLGGYYENYDYDNYADNSVNSTNRNYLAQNRSPYRRGTPMQITPTQQKLVKQTSARINGYQNNRNTRNARRFNFVSKDAEDSYEALYLMCNDCCDINEEYSSCKSSLLSNCQTAKTLLDNLKNSGIKVSESDIKTLNGYYEVLNKCLENIKNNSKCSANVKNINSKKANLASNCGAINADYLQIYNTIDSNCTSCANCNRSIEDMISFVNKILNGAQQSATRNIESGTYNSQRRAPRGYRNYRQPRSERNSYYQNDFYQPNYQNESHINNDYQGNNYQSSNYQKESYKNVEQNSSDNTNKVYEQNVPNDTSVNNEIANSENTFSQKVIKENEVNNSTNGVRNLHTNDNKPNEQSATSNVKKFDNSRVYHNKGTASEYIANKYFRDKQASNNTNKNTNFTNSTQGAVSHFGTRLKDVRA